MRLKDYCQQAEALDDELTNLLRDRTLRDTDNQRLLNGAGAQQDRPFRPRGTRIEGD